MEAYRKPTAAGKKWRGRLIAQFKDLQTAIRILPTLDGPYFSRGEDDAGSPLISAKSKCWEVNQLAVADLPSRTAVTVPEQSNFGALSANSRNSGVSAAAPGANASSATTT